MADDDYDMEVERDPDEPEYYQAKEADFVSQVFEDSKKKESKSDEEPESELESEEPKMRESFIGQCGFHILIPDWTCNLFSINTEYLHPKTFACYILALVFLGILGIVASFSEDGWNRTKGQQIYVFSSSALCGLLGCWILVSAVSGCEEDEEFEAKIGGIGLWELKKTKKQIKLETMMKNLKKEEGLVPFSIEFIMNKLKLSDPNNDRKFLIQMGLGFIWMANISFIVIGYISSDKLHVNHGYSGGSRADMQMKNLLGVLGWSLVTGAILCIKNYMC